MGSYCGNAVAEQVSFVQQTFSKIQDGCLKETKAPSFNIDFQDEFHAHITCIPPSVAKKAFSVLVGDQGAGMQEGRRFGTGGAVFTVEQELRNGRKH